MAERGLHSRRGLGRLRRHGKRYDYLQLCCASRSIRRFEREFGRLRAPNGGTDDWTLLKTPNYVPATVSCCAYNVTYRNNLNVAVKGTAFLVLHNGIGQTVYITSM